MKLRLISSGVLAAAVALWAAGCGGDAETGGTSGDALVALYAGWATYGQRDFRGALQEFQRAASLDSTLADAHNGIGWSWLNSASGRPSRPVLDDAVTSFGRALQEEQALADAWVGLGQALLLRRMATSDLTDAANAFASGLTADASTLYRHDYRSAAQIQAAEAWSHYYAGDASLARARADEALAFDPDLHAAWILVSLAQ